MLVFREPDAVPGMRPARPGELVDESEDLAGRIVRQAAFDERRQVGAEQPQVVLQRRAQPRRGEALGHHAGTEEIAVAPEHVALGSERRLLAVVDGGEFRLRAQALGHRLAHRRQRLRRRALDAEQDQARDDAVADLIDQHLLRRRRRARQERRHVRADAAARDQPDRDRHRDHPDSDRGAAAGNHRTSSTMLIWERSPSPSSVSTLWTLLPLPAMRICLTNFCSFGAVGCRTSRQFEALPSSCYRVEASERRQVAGKRGADALDDAADLRIVRERKRAAALLLPAFDRHGVAADRDGLPLRQDRDLLHLVGGEVEQRPGGDQGLAQHPHGLALGELARGRFDLS